MVSFSFISVTVSYHNLLQAGEFFLRVGVECWRGLPELACLIKERCSMKLHSGGIFHSSFTEAERLNSTGPAENETLTRSPEGSVLRS